MMPFHIRQKEGCSFLFTYSSPLISRWLGHIVTYVTKGWSQLCEKACHVALTLFQLQLIQTVRNDIYRLKSRVKPQAKEKLQTQPPSVGAVANYFSGIHVDENGKIQMSEDQSQFFHCLATGMSTASGGQIQPSATWLKSKVEEYVKNNYSTDPNLQSLIDVAKQAYNKQLEDKIQEILSPLTLQFAQYHIAEMTYRQKMDTLNQALKTQKISSPQDYIQRMKQSTFPGSCVDAYVASQLYGFPIQIQRLFGQESGTFLSTDATKPPIEIIHFNDKFQLSDSYT